jgi:hypothetical protein
MMAGEKAPVKSFVLRPVYAFATLVTILLINAAVVLTKKDNTIENSLASTDTEVQSIASEYNLNDVNNIYDLTLEK